MARTEVVKFRASALEKDKWIEAAGSERGLSEWIRDSLNQRCENGAQIMEKQRERIKAGDRVVESIHKVADSLRGECTHPGYETRQFCYLCGMRTGQ